MPEAPQPATVSFWSRGHPAIRATHRGTLEVTLDPDITARATCVVGVAARVEARDLSGFAGPLTISLRSGPWELVVHATAHAGFRLGRRLVVRRSRHLDADTFATGADADASSLSRELVESLRDAGTRLVLTVRGLRSPGAAGGAVLLLGSPPGDADVVVGGGRRDVDRVVEALQDGRRVALAREDLGAGPLARRAAAAAVALGVPIDTGGLPAELAALLLAGYDPGRPVWIARLSGPGAPGELDDAVHRAICVCSLPSALLPGLLRDVETRLGPVLACVCLDAGRPSETVVRGTISEVREQVGDRGRRRGESLAVLSAAGPSPAERRLLEALLRQGVAPRTIAGAAQAAWGWRRQRVYAALRDLQDRP